jgi:hypothetical protein
LSISWFYEVTGITKTKALMLITIGMFAFILFSVAYNEFAWQINVKPVSELTLSMGYNGLSFSSECTSTRNPILEQTCLTDVPGGYCYHESCGMVSPVIVGQEYRIEVIRP